jgi:hypothetical protein
MGGTWFSFLTGRTWTKEVLKRQWKNFFKRGKELVEFVTAQDFFAREKWKKPSSGGGLDEDGGWEGISSSNLSIDWISEMSLEITSIESSTVIHFFWDKGGDFWELLVVLEELSWLVVSWTFIGDESDMAG